MRSAAVLLSPVPAVRRVRTPAAVPRTLRAGRRGRRVTQRWHAAWPRSGSVILRAPRSRPQPPLCGFVPARLH
jgi:hypothetical protein